MTSPETIDAILKYTTGAGFAIVVAAWFMVKHDRTLQELTKAIQELTLLLRAQLDRDARRELRDHHEP